MKLALVCTTFACTVAAWRWSEKQDRAFDENLGNLLEMIRDSIDNKAPGLMEALEKSKTALDDKTLLTAFHNGVLEGVKRRLDYFNGYINDIHHNRLGNLPKDFFAGYTSFLKTKFDIVAPPPKPKKQYNWRRGQKQFFYDRLDELIVMIRESILAKMDNLVPLLEQSKTETDKKALIEGCNQSIFTAVSTRLEYFNTYVKAIQREEYKNPTDFPKGYAEFAAEKSEKEAKKQEILSRVDEEKRRATKQAAQELRALEGEQQQHRRPPKERSSDVIRVLRRARAEEDRQRGRELSLRDRRDRRDVEYYDDDDESDSQDSYDSDSDYYYDDGDRRGSRIEVVRVSEGGRRSRHSRVSARRAGLEEKD